MGKTLIIKRISNDFDRFVCETIKKANKDIDVVDAFKFHGKIGRRIIKIIKEYNLSIFFPAILKINKINFSKYDQIILFDDYPDLPLIKWIKSKNPESIIKLWLWNIPNYNIEEYKKYCRIYCFDKEYCKRNSIKFIDQFFFNKSIPKSHVNNFFYDIIYIGVDKNRRFILKKLSSFFKENNISFSIKLIIDKRGKTDANDSIEYRRRPIPYEEVLLSCAQCKGIIEIVNEQQMGLTWRSLEALFLKKKLITNNKKIKTYDFYDKRNVFILGEDSLNNLKFFIESPFIEKNYSQIKKYTFDNWFETISKE